MVFLGGVITEWASWPWIFYINVPVGILAVFMCITLLRRGRFNPELARELGIGEDQRVNIILTNPPFGTKGANQAPERDDFTISTSNKQLNFLQHIMTQMKAGGTAAVPGGPIPTFSPIPTAPIGTRPSSTRPPEMWSTVLAQLASTAAMNSAGKYVLHQAERQPIWA